MPLPNVSSTMEKNYHAASQANKSPTSTTSKDYAASLVSTSTTLKGDAASVDSASIMSKDYASTKGLVLGGKEKKSKRAWLIESTLIR